MGVPRPRSPDREAASRQGGSEEELARMTRSSRWSSIAVLAATAAIVFAACGGTTASTAPSATAAAPSASAAASASASAPAFDAINYPATGEAPCGTAPYAGEFKKISAPDARTVVFDLCGSDVAFLSKIAFSSFAINDSDYLAKAVADGSIVGKPSRNANQRP